MDGDDVRCIDRVLCGFELDTDSFTLHSDPEVVNCTAAALVANIPSIRYASHLLPFPFHTSSENVLIWAEKHCTGNQRHSLQLFVVEFDTCLVWASPLLPSNAQTASNLPSLRELDVDTSEKMISAVSMPAIVGVHKCSKSTQVRNSFASVLSEK